MAEESLSSHLLQARQCLHDKWGNIKPYITLVCGSGWGQTIDCLSPQSNIPYTKLSGMGSTTVAGHEGKLWLAKPGGLEVLVFQGRRHFYEGAGWTPVIFPAFLAHALGAQTILLTNAAGGIRPDLHPGDFMVASDHLNFMGSNPLVGQTIHPLIPRFPDQSKVYNPITRKHIHLAAKSTGQKMKEGVYLALSGPAFETPAEIQAYAKLGADAVGMSTVPEAMVANSLGLKVGSISCITNLAAGRSDEALTHEDVCKTSEISQTRMTALLSCLLPALAE